MTRDEAIRGARRAFEALEVWDGFEAWLDAYGSEVAPPTSRPGVVRINPDGDQILVWKTRDAYVIGFGERTARGLVIDEAVAVPLSAPLTRGMRNVLGFAASAWRETVARQTPGREVA